MIEGRPSRTAQRVAARRAAHQLLDGPLIFEDPLALRILGPEGELRVRADPAVYDRSRLARMLRAFLAVRSRFAEDLLADAVARGVTQYVVLGAGLDTFASRNPHPSLRVFEVDVPATQEWKRARLRQAGIPAPPGVVYAPCNLATESAAAALARAGLDATRPTVCSWLGVTMYLERDAVLATIRALTPLVHDPGALVFDYMVPASSLPVMHRVLSWLPGRRVAQRVARAGEPFIASFTPAELVSAVRAMGAEATDHTPAALTARYLSGRRDGLRIGRIGHMMVVRRRNA